MAMRPLVIRQLAPNFCPVDDAVADVDPADIVDVLASPVVIFDDRSKTPCG